MANAVMIQFEFDPGKFVRFLGGEYTGYSCNIQKILLAVKDHFSHEDLAHMKLILLDESPAESILEEPLSNRLEMILRRSSKNLPQ
jgi:hypothetical protein